MTSESTHPKETAPLELANLSRTEFVNAMVHLYRGELGEATAWRSRIDTTTHWAVVLSATALTFTFSNKDSNSHAVIPIIILFCTFLLLMESRRYRFFDIWRSRARMLEINFFRPILDHQITPMQHWQETLALDMEWPHFHMPWWEAAGRRLRRNYQWIYGILLGSWFMELSSYPTTTTSLPEMISRASIGPLSGQIVFAGMMVFYGSLAALGIYSFWASRIKKSLPAGHPGRMSAGRSEKAEA
jgi:uncharacterized membrane protein